MSLGLMSFSNKLRIAAPTESHSACFSGYSAGKLDEPGNVMPIASAAEAIVLQRCGQFVQARGSRAVRTSPYTFLHMRRAQDMRA